MAYTYNKTMTSDFINGLNPGLFTEEINDTTLSGLLSYINRAIDDVELVFDYELNTGQEVILNTTISGHLFEDNYDFDEFLELADTPVRYVGYEGKYVRVSDDATELYFHDAIVGVTSSGTTPPEDSNLWYNTDYNEFFYYDPAREDWLSLTVHNYLFTRQGNIDGLYLSVGDLRHAEAHFPIPKHATVTAVISSAEERYNPSKGFELRDGDVNVLFSFNNTNWEYSNTSTNIQLGENTKLRAFCVSAGSRTRNPAITCEVRWRFVP